MTIEEAIKVIKSALCLWCVDSDKCNLCRVTEALCYIEDMSNELQWYRERDLIRREDVKNDEVLKEIALGFEREFLKTVMMMPKAESPFATDTNVAHKE